MNPMWNGSLMRLKFRLSSMLVFVLILSVMLAIYSTRRRAAREMWTGAEGLWKLSTLTTRDEVYDFDMYLPIQGLKAEYLTFNPRHVTQSKVVPRIHGFDLHTRTVVGDMPLRALYQCDGDELLIYHAEESRPKKMPADVSHIGHNVLLKFIRIPGGSVVFDDALDD